MNNNFHNTFSLHLMTAKEPEINIIAIVIAVLNIQVTFRRKFGGAWSVITMIYDTVLPPLIVAVFTWNEHAGLTMRVPFFHSYCLFLFSAGICFFILGWIFRIGLSSRKKNEGFV